eukprot:gb/GEZN01004624.1/.p1 GENE.gb/GEZN01004624.1/~~gb/GEZN01004624.1/.p1  ORF type:complete len:626 (-),score=87.08 gb/GEZN01004624.1/:55-1665(-)
MAVSLDVTGFLEWFSLFVLLRHKAHTKQLFFWTFSLTVLLTVFTDNDVVIMTLTPVLVYLTRAARLPPMPFLLAEFFAANVGGAARLIGNPATLVVAGIYKLSFLEYLAWMGLPTFLSLSFLYFSMAFFFRHSLSPTSLNIGIASHPAKEKGSGFHSVAAKQEYGSTFTEARQVEAEAQDDDELKGILIDPAGAIVGVSLLFLCMVFLSIFSAMGVPSWQIVSGCACVHMAYNLWTYVLSKHCCLMRLLLLSPEMADELSFFFLGESDLEGEPSESGGERIHDGIANPRSPGKHHRKAMMEAKRRKRQDEIKEEEEQEAMNMLGMLSNGENGQGGRWHQEQQVGEDGNMKRKKPRRRKKEDIGFGDAFAMIPWSVLLFLVCMFILVEALDRQGWVDEWASVCSIFLDNLPYSPWLATVSISTMTCVCCALFNNQPTSILATRLLTSHAFKAGKDQRFAGMLAAIIGTNFGANFTLVGALCGMMWSSILNNHGVPVSGWKFLTYGLALMIVPTVLAATVVAIEVSVWGAMDFPIQEQ